MQRSNRRFGMTGGGCSGTTDSLETRGDGTAATSSGLSLATSPAIQRRNFVNAIVFCRCHIVLHETPETNQKGGNCGLSGGGWGGLGRGRRSLPSRLRPS